MAKSFSASVDAWTRQSERRMTAVFRTAVQNLGSEANREVGSGGRLRVDTGFLRDSFDASLDGMPVGPTRPSEGRANNDIGLIIARAQPGDSIWLGWTANYARPREAKDGFREAAVQRWPEFVRDAVAEARRRIR